jgi:hypothetical protein
MVRIAFSIALVTEMKKQENYWVIKVMMDRTIGKNVIRRNITTDMKID